MDKLLPYMKAIVGFLGAVLTSLAPYYGSAHWYPIVTSVVTAVLVYLVPNAPKDAVAKARAGYERYRQHAGGVSKFTGTKLPSFDEQDAETRSHWVAAFEEK